MKAWIDKLLDSTIVFSFDKSGFMRHCPEPLKIDDLSHCHGMVTGSSSGIGYAVAMSLLQQKMQCYLISRNQEKLKSSFASENFAKCYSLDMSDLKQVYSFAEREIKTPLDVLIHNAGDMPNSLTITKDGFEQMFACQVLAPFILTKTLEKSGKLKPGCRIIFVSSGGMYLQKLDLSDLLFKNRPYNKYTGYANAKRAQVILCDLFSKKYPQYLFSAMHPGWADTPGVQHSMPLFKQILGKRLRTAEEGADTILWLATNYGYPNGRFWFDRKEASPTILNLFSADKKDQEMLWNYCETVFEHLRANSNDAYLAK